MLPALVRSRWQPGAAASATSNSASDRPLGTPSHPLAACLLMRLFFDPSRHDNGSVHIHPLYLNQTFPRWLIRLRHDTGLSAPGDPQKATSWVERNGVLLAACADTVDIGYAWATAPVGGYTDCTLSEVAVTKKWRDRNVGTRLVRAAAWAMLGRGAESMNAPPMCGADEARRAPG